MGGFAVADLKSSPRWRFDATTIGELGYKPTCEDEYDVPSRALVSGAVIRREIDQACA